MAGDKVTVLGLRLSKAMRCIGSLMTPCVTTVVCVL